MCHPFPHSNLDFKLLYLPVKEPLQTTWRWALCSLRFPRRLHVQERIHLLYCMWHLLGDSHIHQSSVPGEGIMFRKYLSGYLSCPVALPKVNFKKPPFYQCSEEYKFCVSNFLEKPKQTTIKTSSFFSFLRYRSIKRALCFSILLWCPIRGSLLRTYHHRRLYFPGIF